MSSKDVSRWNKVKMLFFLSGGGLVYSIYLASEMGDEYTAIAAFLFGLSFVLMVLLQILDKDKDDEEPKKSGVPDGPTLCLWVSFVSFAFGVLVLGPVAAAYR